MDLPALQRTFPSDQDFDHLQFSFSRTGQWMLDALADGAVETMSTSQLEGAMGMWSEQRLMLSSDHPSSQRYSCDVPLPAGI